MLFQRFERGHQPFDGLTLELDFRPPNQLLVALKPIVSALVDRTKQLRSYIDYLEEGGGIAPAAVPASWTSLEDAVANIDALWRSNPGETFVRRAWYPADFSFVLRWWIDLDEEPAEGNADVTGDSALVHQLVEVVSDASITPARTWWESRSE